MSEVDQLNYLNISEPDDHICTDEYPHGEPIYFNPLKCFWYYKMNDSPHLSELFDTQIIYIYKQKNDEIKKKYDDIMRGFAKQAHERLMFELLHIPDFGYEYFRSMESFYNHA
jgi:hypothetical protein